MQICRTNERTSSLLCLCRQLKHSFSSDRATRDSETRLPDRRIKKKKKKIRSKGENVTSFLRGSQAVRRVWQGSRRGEFSMKMTRTSRVTSVSIWEERGGGSIFERSVRFLEKDEKGNVNSSTRVPLHPVRAKSASLFIRGKRDISGLQISRGTFTSVCSLALCQLQFQSKRGRQLSYFAKCRNDSFFLPFTVIIINLSSHLALIYNEIFVSLLKFTFEQSSQQRGELLRIFA